MPILLWVKQIALRWITVQHDLIFFFQSTWAGINGWVISPLSLYIQAGWYLYCFLLQSGFWQQKTSFVVTRAALPVKLMSEAFHALVNYALYPTRMGELLWMPSADQLMPWSRKNGCLSNDDPNSCTCSACFL